MTQTHALTLPAAAGCRKSRNYAHFAVGFAFIAFPLLSIFIYAIHPNLLSLQPVHEVDAWIAEWHGNDLLHFAHVLMLLCVPAIIVISIELMKLLRKAGQMYGFVGGILAITGAVFLAADKGALCLVTSAFDTLSPAAFAQIHPAIEVMKGMQGWLWLVYGLALLPIGFVVLGIGLYRTRTLPRWQAGLLIAGAAFLLNPDIEIISLVASVLLAGALIPLGIERLRTVL